jgi:hypothetical protein
MQLDEAAGAHFANLAQSGTHMRVDINQEQP